MFTNNVNHNPKTKISERTTITLVRNYTSKYKRTIEQITLIDLIQLIKGERKIDGISLADLINEIRNTNDKRKRQTLKEKLPQILATAALDVFDDVPHGEHYYDKWAGLCWVDVDTIPSNRTLPEVRKALCEDPHTLLLFTSSSGLGLKLLVRAPNEKALQRERPNDSYKEEIYPHVAKYYLDKHGLEIDLSCKNINRGSYLSLDPEVYFNPNAQTLPTSQIVRKTVTPIDSTDKAPTPEAAIEQVDHLLKITPNRVGTYEEWIRYLGGVSAFLQRSGVDRSKVTEMLTAKWSESESVRSIEHIVNDPKPTPLAAAENIIKRTAPSGWYEYAGKYNCHDLEKHFVYDSVNDEIIDIRSKVARSRVAFNLLYNQLSIRSHTDGKNRKIKPSEYVIRHGKSVIGTQYAPHEKKPIFQNEYNESILNEYTEPHYEKVPSPHEVQKAREILLGHIKHLIKDEAEQAILLDYMAWCVQRPGKLITWMIILYGVQGDGKSYIRKLMEACMGKVNVGIYSSGSLEDQFCSPSYGRTLTFIEELKLDNFKKYDVLERMKGWIGNERVSVRKMRKEATEFRATANYIAATNHSDCLPADHNERRFCVLTSRWAKRKDELRKWVEKNPTYYKTLYSHLENAPEAYRQVLLNHRISPDFEKIVEAPRTTGTLLMAEQSRSKMAVEIEGWIDDWNRPTINEKFVYLRHLKGAYENKREEGRTLQKFPHTKDLGRYLEELGYTEKHAFVKRSERKSIKCTAYAKPGITQDEIKQAIFSTNALERHQASHRISLPDS